VSVSFLLFGLGGRIKSIIPHAASFLQNYTDITAMSIHSSVMEFHLHL
jgi:hypothetical protein